MSDTQRTLQGEFVCVMCPNGCLIEAELTDSHPPKLKSLTGNRCKKGKFWVSQEIENPARTIATSLPVSEGNFGSVSVRTVRAVPREKIFDVMEAIRALGTLKAPLRIGQVLLKNPAGTDTDIVVTRQVERRNAS
jgi:CxxC motif-containing protein